MPIDPPASELMRQLAFRRVRIAAGKNIPELTESTSTLGFVIEGMGARYVALPNGLRQTLAFLLPGDLTEPEFESLLDARCHIRALSALEVALVHRDSLTQLAKDRPILKCALDTGRRIERAIIQQWLLSLGRRDAIERMAHLMCELHFRLEALGRAAGGICTLPFTQADLGDALAITPVHVNRVLKEIRERGLAQFTQQRLVISDLAGLRELAGFDASYLRAEKANVQPPIAEVLSKATPDERELDSKPGVPAMRRESTKPMRRFFQRTQLVRDDESTPVPGVAHPPTGACDPDLG